MNEIKFFVQGSAPEPYLVVFHKSENNLTGLCNCPAGENGMYCKHRFRILAGSSEGIVSENINDAETVKNWVKGSDVEKALEELHQAETDLEKMKKKFSVGREERSLILIANFEDGYSSDFFFKLPTSFRDALDIKLTPRMIHGKIINTYSQGKNFSFKQGDVVYDAKEAYTLEWGEALKYIKYSLQVIDSRDATTDITESYEIKNSQIKYIKKDEPDKIVEKDIIINKYNYDSGYVKFRLLQPNDKKEKLVDKSVYECSQENFVLLLQSGVLRTIDKQEINLSKA